MAKKETFSLKDALFNEQKVEKIAQEIQAVYPSFEVKNFMNEVLTQFLKLELKQRITHIQKMLKKYLPLDYIEALTILSIFVQNQRS